MEPDTPAVASATRTGAIGTLVAVWWAIDGLVLLTVIVLASWVNPLLVFAEALVVCLAINLACCNWINRQWDRWMANAGKRLERFVLVRPLRRWPRLALGFALGDVIRAA